MKVTSPIMLLTLLAMSCSPDTGDQETRWKRVGGLSGGRAFHFVVVDAQSFRDAAAYNEAAKSLCHNSDWCEVAFFRSQAEAPPSQSNADFFRAGGYRNYKTVAVYHKNAGTRLDRMLFNCYVFVGYGDNCMGAARPL